MDTNVVAIMIFIAFSILTPISMVLTSRALRRRTTRNPVKDGAYESGEESVGTRTTVMREYLHYFSMFISLEILAAVAIVWAPIAKSVPLIPGLAVIALIGVGLVFEAFVVLIARMV